MATGLLSTPGFDPTPGTWTLVVRGSGPALLGLVAGKLDTDPAFVALLESGAPLLLLGAGLLGVAALRFARRRQ